MLTPIAAAVLACAAAGAGAQQNPSAPVLYSAEAVDVLFAKRKVNGAELLFALRAVQLEMRQRQSTAAVAKTIDAANQALTVIGSGGPGGIGQMVARAALALVEAKAKEAAATLAFQALDEYLTYLIDSPALLQMDYIELPSPQGMSPALKQRTVTMAAAVVGARVSGRILNKAKADFKGLESSYKTLIQRREAAAKLFYEALAQQRDGAGGEAKAQLDAALSPKERALVDGELARMSVKDFVNDLGAQNLALKVLRERDPAAYGDYRAQADELIGKTKAYVRTVSGVAAFGGLTAVFINEVIEVAKQKDLGTALQLLPFAVEFVKDATPLIGLAAEVSTTGFLESTGGIFDTRKSFRIVEGDRVEEVRKASDVFEQLRTRSADALLADALFSSDGPGLLQKVYVCDRGETGRMLDAAVPAEERVEFARTYFGSAEGAEGFSFTNAFTRTDAGRRERELSDQLLGQNHRGRTSDATGALAKVQATVAAKYDKWDGEQLLRLIFANREADAAQATLQLGAVRVRPIPTLQSVFIYETFIDACKTVVASAPPPAEPVAVTVAEPEPAPPPPAAKPAAKPGAKPPAKPSATAPANKPATSKP